MSNKSTYTCSSCGQTHEEWPALAFISPTGYDELDEDEKTSIGELSHDFCVVRHPEQTDRYIRVTLTIKVNDHCEDLNYGVWVSLSEKSFHDYKDNFNNPADEAKYFGWLANLIPGYNWSNSVPTTVFTRKNGQRPEVVPHYDFDHPLVTDYYEGITRAEAEKRIADMLKTTNEDDTVSTS